MNEHRFAEHLSPEEAQAFLDGQLAPEGRRRAEEHLGRCARCAAELETWRTLFEELEDLPVLAPAAGFTERVLGGLEVTAPPSLPARVGSRLRGLLPVAQGHPGNDRLQDFVEGLLPARRAARVRTHLEACGACAHEAIAWQGLLARLDGVERFAPSADFPDRVMAHVHVKAPAREVARAPEWRRALARAGRLVPHSRRAWAALSGVALTPAVTLGLLLWTLVAHPTLTLGALASFAWWKTTALAASAWRALASAAVESTGLFEVYTFVDSLVSSPALLAMTFLAVSAGTLSAAWILYRNLLSTHPVDGGYAHVSPS